MRNKTAVNLGIGYEDLKKVKPDLVYCGAQGFGEEGRVQTSQLMMTSSRRQADSLSKPDSEGRPRYLPTIVVDKVAGLQLQLGSGRFD